jgi:glutamyl/glutaminyl-tRNA synthetase
VFVHHPLISKPDGAKLSKASGDTGIRELRRAGVRPATVLGRAAWLTGLLERPRDVSVAELGDLFR